MDKKYDIFISYRRVDSDGKISGRDIAHTIQLELKRRPANEPQRYEVFFDYHEIREGDFAKTIIPAIKGCKVFILVLSKDALLRCSNEDDWVRREIVTAMESGCKIVNVTPIDPLNPTNTFRGWPSDLPDELLPITKIDVAEIIIGKNFEKSIDKLEEDCIRPVIPFVGELSKMVKLGGDFSPKDIYFEPERASSQAGFLSNRYFPRSSVDGQLEIALMEQRKYIVLLGVPGSGKTRAIYQLLAKDFETGSDGLATYAMGALSTKNVVVVNQNNVAGVFKLLQWEKNLFLSEEKTPEDCYLLCDQVKDVFRMLHNNDDLFKFFDLIDGLPHIKLIATSIPSAFVSFCERWKEYGRRPFEDDQKTVQITIPPLSSDPEENTLRNWIQNEWRADSFSESIGDYIPQLNKYKQDIVGRTYKKAAELPFLRHLLTAIQIVETFRHDTALFLPILVARKSIYREEKPNVKEFQTEMAKTLNYLIGNNIIWVTDPRGNMLKMVKKEAFELEYDYDDEEDFIFDEEVYPDTIISTAYSYGVNEIVWKHLEQEDANRHISSNSITTLLKDFQSTKDVVRAARDFYRAIPWVSTLRRILPRIPRTDCYEEAFKKLWDFVFKECANIKVQDENKDEFVTTIGMLIGRSKTLQQVRQAMNILESQGTPPSYDIIGELYSVGYRMGAETKKDVSQYISDIREKNGLTINSFFSLSREIVFKNLNFADQLTAITDAKYFINSANIEKVVTIDELAPLKANKRESFSIRQLLGLLSKRADHISQWKDIFELYIRIGFTVRRKEIRQFFAVVSEEMTRLQHTDANTADKLLEFCLLRMLNRYATAVSQEDRESLFFYSIEYARNFRQSHAIYQHYIKLFDHDNPRLISRAIRTLRDNEFQTVLYFLNEVTTRMKSNGKELSVICFNNLIKMAPNISEAIGIIPYLTHIQDHTLANILTVLKRRTIKDEKSKTGKKQDPKIFYYAYSVVMLDVFEGLRASIYVIGQLYDLATTPKHETFIREIFLRGVPEQKKCELIDYSTTVSSIRIKKNYRGIDDIWKVFNTCRKHYSDKSLYIASELYSNMMKKINFLYNSDKQELLNQLQKLYDIIMQDWARIVRDEYFFSSIYRFMPNKQIFDCNGNICNDFMNDMRSSNIQQVKVLNNIMSDLKSKGFEKVWTFYEYIVDYYRSHGKWSLLKPEIHTITYLMETVKTEEQYTKAEEAARQWLPEHLIQNNKIYEMACEKAKQFIRKGSVVVDNRTNGEEIMPNESVDEPPTEKRNYREETDDVINCAIKDIYLYGSLTSSQLNMYLRIFLDIVSDIHRDRSMREEVVKKCVQGTYWNLYLNLIEKYRELLIFDIHTYVTLIKLSPDEMELKKWTDELVERENEFKYNMVACREIASSVEVSRYDINLSYRFFCCWEDIMNDIGYDPDDPESVSEVTNVTILSDKITKDYDNYWITRRTHVIREMNHYCYEKSFGNFDETALIVIKRQMELFDKYGIPFPNYTPKGRISQVDFREEIKKLH